MLPVVVQSMLVNAAIDAIDQALALAPTLTPAPTLALALTLTLARPPTHRTWPEPFMA
jgi:hypothetical protein